MPARRIDVHHHIVPPQYVERAGDARIGAPSPRGRAPHWSPEDAIETMDRNGISVGLTSISAPGVILDDPKATRDLARLCNEYSAQLSRDHPDRFGMFASLPLPEVDASLGEIDYAFDTLKTDGIVLMTNYERKYLGDPLFTPVMELLNQRKAVVFVHPTVCGNPNCHPEVSTSTLEFPFDTARTIVSLLFNRVFGKFPDIRFIFSHAGGAITSIAGRVAVLSQNNPRIQAEGPLEVMATLGRIYYDVAIATNAPVFRALREIAPIEHILFGTDYPFASASLVNSQADRLRELGLDQNELAMIDYRNAVSLFPRFA